MKNKNLITVFLLILIMLCSVTAYAETNETDSLYTKGKFYLETFGVDTTGLDYDTPVTRGFAANALSKALFDDLTITSDMAKFADVPATSPYASAAFFLNDLGIMQGDGTNFNPDKNITYTQAAKVFVSALGKDIVAQTKGGWPHGYLNVATTSGIFDGVSVAADDALTFGDFAKMYYNFTGCKGFVMGGDNFGIYSQDDSTVLQYKMRRCDMIYIEGVVTGNQFGSVSSNELGKIYIEGVEYDFECDLEGDYIGYYVNAFLTKKNYKYVVTSIIRDDYMNNVRTLTETDIANVTRTEVRYYDGDNVRKLKLSDLSVVRNGRILSQYFDSDLSPLNGGLKLIDNDRDGKYEYLYIENKQFYTVQRTSREKNVIILEDGAYEGSTHIYVNPEDEEFYHRIYNIDGEPASFGDITGDTVIRIEGIAAQNLLRVYIVDTIVEGRVQQISADDHHKVYINGKGYAIAKDTAGNPLVDINELVLNTAYEFTVDGEYIIKNDKVKTESTYGYVIDTRVDPGLSGKISYLLVSEDKQVYEGELADRVFDGTRRVKKDDFVPKSGVVVSYQIDSDGKICSLVEAELYSTRSDKKYTPETGILTSQTYDYPLFMSEDTVVFVVPDSGLVDDYMADLTMIADTYTCESYDYNEEDSSISVLVLYEDVTYETPGFIDNASPVCILKSARKVLDEEGESIYQLTWLEGSGENNEEMKAYIKDTPYMNNQVSKMGTGDVFQYSKTSRGFIDNVNVLVAFNENPAYFHNGEATKLEQVYGKVVSVDLKTLPKGYYGKFANIIELDVDEEKTKNFVVIANETVNYYVYDSVKKEVKYASVDDILTEDGVLGTFAASEVYIYLYGPKENVEAKAVVIKN